jgi:hypothetical protein
MAEVTKISCVKLAAAHLDQWLVERSQSWCVAGRQHYDQWLVQRSPKIQLSEAGRQYTLDQWLIEVTTKAQLCQARQRCTLDQWLVECIAKRSCVKTSWPYRLMAG